MEPDNKTVKFPEISQILPSRRSLVKVIFDRFAAEVGAGPILLITGKRATLAYGEVYKALINERWNIDAAHYPLAEAPSAKEAEKVSDEISKWERLPTLVVYVGGQTVGDATKVIVRNLRKLQHQRAPDRRIAFGAIITSLSNDGIFSVTASVRDSEGLPKSETAVAPDFVVGHLLTLLRQPYTMKISCVGDILAKISSLWDYNYSCSVLTKYHHDFAADLTKSAYEIALDDRFTQEYLHDPDSIGDLYRSVQLCGLSMQLAGSSETCSGSEHVGQKWIEEYITRYNGFSGAHKRRLAPFTHGEAVTPTTLVALHLQGQAKKAKDVRRISEKLGLRYKVADLGIPATVMQACLALGLGYRCPLYLAYLLTRSEMPVGNPKERVTVLEEIETKVLPDAIKTAMIDAQVAKEADFTELDGVELVTMRDVLRAATSSAVKRMVDEGIEKDAAADAKRQIEVLFQRLIPPGETRH